MTAALCRLPTHRPPPDGPHRARSLVRFDLRVLQAEAERHPGTTPFRRGFGTDDASLLLARLEQNERDVVCKLNCLAAEEPKRKEFVLRDGAVVHLNDADDNKNAA